LQLSQEELVARSSPAGLLVEATRNSPTPWTPYRFHRLINRYLLEVAAGRISILVLQVPIQHGKTSLASVANAVWTLGCWPDKVVQVLSHTQRFARDKVGAPARGLFERYGEKFYSQRIDRRSDASDRFTIQGRAGGLFTNGVDGSIEGSRIDLLVLDDIIGTYEQANNDEYQKWLFEDYYSSQVVGRLAPGAGTVVAISRWAKQDFVGRLIDAGANGQGPVPVVLDLPAIALEPEEYAGGRDPLDREPGEALWPEVRNRAYLDDQRRRMGERHFSARYQERPGEAAGVFFKKEWFRYYEFEQKTGFLVVDDWRGGSYVPRRLSLSALSIRQYVDLATSLKKEADWFVITTVGVDPRTKDLYVINITRVKVPGPEQGPLMKGECWKWKPRRVKIEAVGFQLSFVQSMVNEGLPVFPLNRGRGDKAERANYIAVRYEQGAVFHPRTAPWLKIFEDELLAFPRGHDDQVDTIADAGNDLLDESEESELVGQYVDA